MIRLTAAAALAAVLAGAPRAQAQDTCASAYENAQELRRSRELSRSRGELLLCERACPKKLADDCAAWRTEIEADLASIVISAVDFAGRPVSKARVTLDGAPLSDEIAPGPVEIDPGKHTLAFDDGAGGRAQIDVTLAPGEKAHAVSVQLSAPPPKAPVVVVAPKPPRESGPAIVEKPVSHSAAPWVLGGLGVGALGAGAVLGIKGQIEKSQLAGECAPICNKAKDVDPISTEWWTGAGLAIAGGVLLGAATAVWFGEGRAKPRPKVTLVPGPGWLAVAGSF